MTTNRKKGHDFERRVVAALRSHGFPNAKRHDEQAPGAVLGFDIENTAPFIIQCKRHQAYAPISAIFEIPATSLTPVLITQPDDTSQPAMAVLPFSAFLMLLSNHLPPTPEDF
jgi:hypothetical protein